MLLGTLLPLVLLSVGTKIVPVFDENADENVQLGFLRTHAHEFKPDDKNCHASLYSSYRWKKLPKVIKDSKIAPLAYLRLLTISLSSDIELNPCPDYPCGTCGSEVLDTNMAIVCDNCCNWFHVSCQGIGESTYHSLSLETSFSWTCLICFERLSPNFIADTMNWFLSSMLD